MSSILIHICCAPCAIEVVNESRRMGFDNILGYYANPNIHPYSEFKKREKTLFEYCKLSGLSCEYLDCNPYSFFKALAAEYQSPKRCWRCWELRLKLTAKFAKDRKIDSFTTTLLISPYQSQEKIIEIGEEAGREYGLNFISLNFRKFYSEGRRRAKELDLYRQNYCGCIFSEFDREERIKSKKQNT
ncbi:MAG: epoxyqueuosine reductase QueH [Candidatus Kaelpia imicola]|nr:epoxyqueuosine reductase QueH [Candidatus Kaelpia imicola]